MTENSAVHFDYIFNQAHNTLFEEEKEAEHSAFQKSRKTRKAQELMTRLQLCFLGLPLDVLHQERSQSRTCVADRERCVLGEFVERTHHHIDSKGSPAFKERKGSMYSAVKSKSHSPGQGAVVTLRRSFQ